MTATPFILFPHQPFSPREIDTEFASEYEAARLIGFETGFYSHEAVEAGDIKEALAFLPMNEKRKLILRGWMLRGECYSALFEGLVATGYEPVVSATAYEEAHYLPLAYQCLEGHTSRSSWIEGDDVEAAWKLYQGFRAEDAIIKDWVKSAKAKWKDACFIPAGTSRQRFQEMFAIFREERGNLFNRGVVLREFLPIVERGSDVKGLPVIEETRLFFWKGKVVVPPEGRSPNPMSEIGRWEVDDAGVSGLPITLEPRRFYGALWNHSLKEDQCGTQIDSIDS